MVYRRNSTFTRRDSGEYVRDDGKATLVFNFTFLPNLTENNESMKNQYKSSLSGHFKGSLKLALVAPQ